MGKYVGTYQMDARPDRIDLRDRIYAPPLRALRAEYPAAEDMEQHFPRYANLVLDQGKEGACTGFGLASTINYLLWRQIVFGAVSDQEAQGDGPVQVSQRMLYHLARFYDEWPGEDYEGSSCRGAIKAWHKHGVCRLELWPYVDGKKKVRFIRPLPGWEEDAALRPLGVYYRIEKNSITDIQAAIQEVGAVYVAAEVHQGWDLSRSREKRVTHQTLPRIAWQEELASQGGHAFVLVGYNRWGFIVQNSWSSNWGLKGFALLAYDDWRVNGRDAWVCVMGAPTETRARASFVATAVVREQSLLAADPATFALFRRQEQAHVYQDPAVSPWDEETAYRHTLVMGNDGRVINRLVANNGPLDAVEEVVVRQPGAWFSQQPANAPLHLVFYAHGGLNSEGDSLGRIRILAPYFQANGVYPLFLTWKTGMLESIAAIMDDAVGRLFPRSEGMAEVLREASDKAADVLDRTIEVAAENLGVKAIWSQMKQNGAAAAERGEDRGVYLAVRALARLQAAYPGLRLHLVGHSAGSLLLGHLLRLCPRASLRVTDCTLYAPACSIDFANAFYLQAVANGTLAQDCFHLHLLSDEREQADTVGPYRKSLLYLVSRALETRHKTPLLGMANAFVPQHNTGDTWHRTALADLERWQEFWRNRPLAILDDSQVLTAAVWEAGRVERAIERITAAHGSFDNDIQVIAATIERMLGRPLAHQVENLRY